MTQFPFLNLRLQNHTTPTDVLPGDSICLELIQIYEWCVERIQTEVEHLQSGETHSSRQQNEDTMELVNRQFEDYCAESSFANTNQIVADVWRGEVWIDGYEDDQEESIWSMRFLKTGDVFYRVGDFWAGWKEMEKIQEQKA